MLRKIARCLSLLLLSAATVSFAQEFSADVYSTSNKENPKIYVANNKLRIESKDHGGKVGVVLVNLATQMTDVLVPEHQMYMEMQQGQGPAGQRLFSFFRIDDVDNACGQWQKLARKPGGTCHKAGNEAVNGRNTIKYEGTSAEGDTNRVWIDPKLRFPIKWEGKDKAGELRNIQEGSQPASLFEIPAGYQKMDIGGMMQHPTTPNH